MKSNKIIFSIMILLFWQIAGAKISTIDSLQHLLKSASSAERLKLLLEMNRLLLSTDLTAAKNSLDEAFTLAQEFQDSLALAEINLGYGVYYYAQGGYVAASQYLYNALVWAERHHNDGLAERAMNTLAVIYVRLNEKVKAEEIFLKLIALAEKNQQSQNRLKYRLNYSTFLSENGRYIEAEKIFFLW